QFKQPQPPPAPVARAGSISGWILLLPLAFFAVAGTHDCFAYNRARWQALNMLMNEKHISPQKIDGGLEFNGWMAYQQANISAIRFNIAMARGDEYTLSLTPLAKYSVVGEYPFARWLMPGKAEVFILHRQP